MRSESNNIPLFLWIAAALVVHAMGGESVTKVVEQLEETFEIGDFASSVRRQAQGVGRPVEISMISDDLIPEETPSPAPLVEPPENSNDSADTDPPLTIKAKEKKKDEKQKSKVAQKEKKKPDLGLTKAPPPARPPPASSRRVAVDQHVEDKNQEDNPNAEFAGEHANRVKEQTRAQITATDQNAEKPTLGQNFAGEDPAPGNSDESRVAQSDENDASADEAPALPAPPPTSNKSQKEQEARQASKTNPSAGAKPPPPVLSPQEAKRAAAGRDAVASTMNSSHGTFSVQKSRAAEAAQKAQQARRTQAHIPPHLLNQPQGMLGLGAKGTTDRGVNLNINQQMARAAVGLDKMAQLRRKTGKRRLTKHRGSWTSVGLERWRPALENYVANVKPGNQTALNTARVPFARYLNQIHQRLHEVFAHGFLGHLDQLPPKHPLNNQQMSTHLEIALSREDGRIVKMGITKSSGVTAFDVGALESVKKAAPYGVPPGSIVSSDGNVYLHWEFHRKPAYACSTYFAKPYIINREQKSAPPHLEAPPQPRYEEKKKSGERSGSIQQERKRASSAKAI